MPLEAPYQDTPDLPFANFEVTHKDVIGVAQNSIIKYKYCMIRYFICFTHYFILDQLI